MDATPQVDVPVDVLKPHPPVQDPAHQPAPPLEELKPRKAGRGIVAAVGGLISRFLRGVGRWLAPVHVGEDGDQTVLIYTSFPKAFYLYLVWVPGFLSLAAYHFELVTPTAVAWVAFLSMALTYLVCTEDFTPKGFVVLVCILVTVSVLYSQGFLAWTGFPRLVDKLKSLKFALDVEMVSVFTQLVFYIWCCVYLYAVTWRKRELSSLRRSKLRPPFGRKPISISGLTPDPDIGDVFEFVLGFGAYDVNIESTHGDKVIDRDKNCVGLWFFLSVFNDIISRIATTEKDESVKSHADS